MNVIGKILRGDDIRPSRLHTESGQYCGNSALPELLLAALSWLRLKLTGRYLAKPWWVFKAIREVAKSLRRTDRVLEVGAGYSTIWLAQRCQYVCSIEESSPWASIVTREAHQNGLGNIEILIGDSRLLLNQQLRIANWDVLVIDGSGDRLGMFKDLLSSPRRPRILIYDDTDKAPNQVALQVATQAYVRDTYRGFKPQTLHACETTVYQSLADS
jgi:hypothetical protein